MTIKHLGSLSYSRHFATINNLFYLHPLQRIGYVFAPYVAFYVTGIHMFYTAIIIIMVGANHPTKIIQAGRSSTWPS